MKALWQVHNLTEMSENRWKGVLKELAEQEFDFPKNSSTAFSPPWKWSEEELNLQMKK